MSCRFVPLLFFRFDVKLHYFPAAYNRVSNELYFMLHEMNKWLSPAGRWNFLSLFEKKTFVGNRKKTNFARCLTPKAKFFL